MNSKTSLKKETLSYAFNSLITGSSQEKVLLSEGEQLSNDLQELSFAAIKNSKPEFNVADHLFSFKP